MHSSDGSATTKTSKLKLWLSSLKAQMAWLVPYKSMLGSLRLLIRTCLEKTKNWDRLLLMVLRSRMWCKNWRRNVKISVLIYRTELVRSRGWLRIITICRSGWTSPSRRHNNLNPSTSRFTVAHRREIDQMICDMQELKVGHYKSIRLIWALTN